MDSDVDQGSSESRTKADVLSSFILHAPPGEFREVLSDVNGLVQNDEGVKEEISRYVIDVLNILLPSDNCPIRHNLFFK